MKELGAQILSESEAELTIHLVYSGDKEIIITELFYEDEIIKTETVSLSYSLLEQLCSSFLSVD